MHEYIGPNATRPALVPIGRPSRHRLARSSPSFLEAVPLSNPLAVSSQRNRLGALQRFFAWLCRHHRLDANPASDLELPRKPPRGLPRGLSREPVRAVLALPDVGDPLGIRDRAILETFYATGMRRSELVGLDLSDLAREGETLRIHKGKGGKSRVVPVGASALKWLAAYLEKTRPKLLLDSGEQALFLSGYGERMSATYVGNWVTRTVKAADVGRKGSCHLFRHPDVSGRHPHG